MIKCKLFPYYVCNHSNDQKCERFKLDDDYLKDEEVEKCISSDWDWENDNFICMDEIAIEFAKEEFQRKKSEKK